MNIKKINELNAEKKWTALLAELPEGDDGTTLQFSSLDDIKSCKAIAYSINSDRTGRRYTFTVNKDKKEATIKVEKIEVKEDA